MGLQLLVSSLKHLPGRHNQKDHGRGHASTLAQGIDATVKDLYQYSLDTKREKLVMLDETGNKLWDDGGTGTAHETGEFFVPDGATAMVHNHPARVDFFTDADISLFLNDPQLKTSTIVTGSGLVHTMSKTPKTQLLDDPYDPKIGALNRKLYSKASDKFEDDWLDDKLTDREYKTKVGIEYMKTMADELNFDYEYGEL